MRVIVPLLVTALWACAAIHIEGVWPPAQTAQTVGNALALLEEPATTMTAQIADDSSVEANPKRVIVQSPGARTDQYGEVREFSIAPPTRPQPTTLRLPARPVCG